MSSLKRWRQIGQGQFHKWETPGDELEGTWPDAVQGGAGHHGFDLAMSALSARRTAELLFGLEPVV